MTGIYIHVPFCLRKCRYCDFYSVGYSEAAAEGYVNEVIRRLKGYDVTADSVYFGGGTPSLLSPESIAEILSAADIAPNAEITMECNPATADREKLMQFKSAGINRLSLGIQSLNDRELAAAGRLHNAEEAVQTVIDADKSGFENISADIMIGLPYQTEASLTNTLNGITSLPVKHISAYMLKIEEGTPLASDSTLLENIPDDDRTADMYLLTCDILRQNGFPRYEISNFAKTGFESRHNLKYWRCEDYIGIGPGAHSCYNGKRYAFPRSVEKFMAGADIEEVTDSSPRGRNERIMLGLRLSEGINALDFPDGDALLKRAAPLEKGGFVTTYNGRIAVTDKGCLVSNEIICRIIG